MARARREGLREAGRAEAAFTLVIIGQELVLRRTSGIMAQDQIRQLNYFVFVHAIRQSVYCRASTSWFQPITAHLTAALPGGL